MTTQSKPERSERQDASAKAERAPLIAQAVDAVRDTVLRDIRRGGRIVAVVAIAAAALLVWWGQFLMLRPIATINAWFSVSRCWLLLLVVQLAKKAGVEKKPTRGVRTTISEAPRSAGRS